MISFPTTKENKTFSKFGSPVGFNTKSVKKDELILILRDARTYAIYEVMKSSISNNILGDYVYP